MIARSRTDALWPPRLALLAGGLATRLHPLTLHTPKSLIPIAGEPFLAHQLRRLHQNGLREIVICCGHLGHQIEAFAGSGNRFGLSIEYSRDGDQLLGTGAPSAPRCRCSARVFSSCMATAGSASPSSPSGALTATAAAPPS